MMSEEMFVCPKCGEVRPTKLAIYYGGVCSTVIRTCSICSKKNKHERVRRAYSRGVVPPFCFS